MDINNSRKVSGQRLKNLEILRLYLKRSHMHLEPFSSKPNFHFQIGACEGQTDRSVVEDGQHFQFECLSSTVKEDRDYKRYEKPYLISKATGGNKLAGIHKINYWYDP